MPDSTFSGDFKAGLEAAKEKILSDAPDEIAALGGIIREAIEKGNVTGFKKFLEEQEMSFDGSIEHLMDLIIIQRLDLKDLEPAARVRLRARTLQSEDPAMMTPDYKTAVEADGIPNCRDCRWFVTGPDDMGEHDNKSCVEHGTKGADQACFGFLFKEKLQT
jgi:hypothetical protein